MAERASVSVELVSRIERGRCLPSLETLVAFAHALQCTPDDLLGFDPPRQSAEIARFVRTLSPLPRARVRELLRIAEALGRYERLPKR